MPEDILKIDNEIYQKNMKCLSKIGPGIYNALMELEGQSLVSEVTETKNGMVNLRVLTSDRRFYIHSNFDPLSEAEKIDICEKTDGVDTLVILGIGLGYHIEYFIDNYPKKKIIIIEPDVRLLKECLSTKDFSKVFSVPGIRILLGSNAYAVAIELINLIYDNEGYIFKFTSLPSYASTFKNFWAEMQQEFLKSYKDVIFNINTNQWFNAIWTENIIKNMPQIPNSAFIKDFTGKFKNVPGIVVASGPSLSENIHLLKGLEDKALVVSAGTSLYAMLSANIMPHIILGVDGGMAMWHVYSRICKRREWDQVIMAYSLNLQYKCANNYQGSKLLFRTNAEYKAEFIDQKLRLNMPEILSGPSCANTAADFLYNLGCDPIIYIGQDLCYSKERTHAQNVLVNCEINDRKNEYITEKNMDGDIVNTTHQLLCMKTWFERYHMLRPDSRTFINASRDGLPIKGTIHMKMEEVIEKYCAKNKGIKGLLQGTFAQSLHENSVTVSDIQNLIEELNKDALRSMKLSKERLSLLNSITKNLKKRNMENIKKKRIKMDKITDKLENNDFFKQILWIENGDLYLAAKINAESRASKENDVFKKLEILYGGLELQYNEILTRAVSVQKNLSEELTRMEGGN